MKIALCILTFNELNGCKNDIPLVSMDSFDEVYAVDGGSTDGTIDYLTSMGIPIFVQPKPGYNAAYIHAFEKCQSEALVLFHPKGSIHPSELQKFLHFFDKGYDLVIAGRNIRGARNEEDDKLLKPRKWFVTGLAVLSSVLWRREGNFIWDVLHGLRGVRKDKFFDMDLLDKGLSMDLELVVKSYKKKLNRIEFPVREYPRAIGTTHFKALPTGAKLLKYIFIELYR